jgi:hypothetical protein
LFRCDIRFGLYYVSTEYITEQGFFNYLVVHVVGKEGHSWGPTSICSLENLRHEVCLMSVVKCSNRKVKFVGVTDERLKIGRLFCRQMIVLYVFVSEYEPCSNECSARLDREAAQRVIPIPTLMEVERAC